MKNECPLTRCEPLTALAILRGDLAPPCPAEDPHPFVPFVTYVRERCPRWAAPVHEAPDADEDCHNSPELADVFSIAWRTVLELRVGPPNIRHCLLNTTRIRILHLRDYCRRLEDELAKQPYNFELVEETGRVLDELVRLRQHCNVALAETGDREALASLAEDAEEQIRARHVKYLPFAVGARVLLLGDTLGCWREGRGPLGIVRTALALGTDSLAQRERAAAGRVARDAAGGDETDDDRAGIVRIPHQPIDFAGEGEGEGVPEPEPQIPGVLVFPETILTSVGKGDNVRDAKAALKGVLGERLPLVPVPADWDAWCAGHVASAPWLAPFVRAVRSAQGARTHWGPAAVCVVGPPGAGKTRMARELASSAGLHFVRFNCDNTSDNSFGGSSIRWNSGHMSAVELALAQAKAASAMICLDEIDKIAGSRQSNGGDMRDVLHSLWEPETAREWRSVFFTHAVDVSYVVYVCTANTTETIPTSLKDRMRIVRVGEPGPEHLNLLAPAIAREACAALGQDERWATLDGEERSALADAWQGGSVRRLGKLVEAVLAARDGAPVARH